MSERDTVSLKIVVPRTLHRKWRVVVSEIGSDGKTALEYLINLYHRNKGGRLI